MTNENTPAHEDDGWFVSSFSTDGGYCVEVKFAGPGSVLVRDSKDRGGDPIVVPSRGWASLLGDIAPSS